MRVSLCLTSRKFKWNRLRVRIRNHIAIVRRVMEPMDLAQMESLREVADRKKI